MPVTDELRRKFRFGSELHGAILRAVKERRKLSESRFSERYDDFRASEEQFLAYLPESEADRLRKTGRNVGEPQQTTLVIPHSYAIMLTAHTYWTAVLLGRDPVFQFQGRHGEAESNVQMVEAIIGYQLLVGKCIVPFYLWLMDVAKYGFGVVGYHWDSDVIQVSRFVERPVSFLGIPIPNAKPQVVRETETIRGYEGNRLFNVRPYNWFPDPRVPLTFFQKGEFCGVLSEGTSKLDVLENEEYFNKDVVQKLRSSQGSPAETGSAQIQLPTESEEILQPLDAKDVGTLDLLEMYIRLVPRSWGLGDSERSEKWVFTIVNGQVIVGARPQGDYHNQFPFGLLEYEFDAHSLLKRSPLDVLRPMQDILDWLINTHLTSVRRVINDFLIVDPSMVVMSDITDPNPGKLVRARPRGYGSGLLDKAVLQIPVQDVTQQHVADAQMLMGLMQRVIGATDQVMGEPLPSGRRSATEARQTASFGVNRLKTNTEFYSAAGWSDVAMGMLQNTQQYLENERRYRIVGDTVNLAGDQLFTTVRPEDIQGFFDYIPVDGTLPVDRFAMAATWQQLLSVAGQIPGVLGTYDIGGIFAWVSQLAGLKNIKQFRLQITDDMKLALQMQQGNVVGLNEVRGNGRGNGSGLGAGGEDQAGSPGEPSSQSGVGRIV